MTPSSESSAARTNRSMPHSAVIPELAYPDVREAAEWLCRAFGFAERLRIGDHRAQLTFGDGSLIVTRRPGEAASDGASSHAVMVRVADADTARIESRLDNWRRAG